MKRAIFPGSFDPFTIGHYDIVLRGLTLFDEIIIGVGVNPSKKSLFPVEKRLSIIEQAFANEPRVKAMQYNSLTIDFAQAEEASYILRGIRTVGDFEYERTTADNNQKLSGIETVVLFTDTKYASISSTIVRDLITYEKDISRFLPPNVSL